MEYGLLKVDFDCKEIGLFAHPYHCTKFVSCNEHLEAEEEDCPPCTDHDRDICPVYGMQLYFNNVTKECDWTSHDRCPPTTTAPPTTTTTLPPTTTASGKKECTPDCQETGYCTCYDLCVPSEPNHLQIIFSKIMILRDNC